MKKEGAMMSSNKEYVEKDLDKKLEWFKNNTNYDLFAMLVRGSQNYNLDIRDDNYTSDVDVVALVVPSVEDVIKNQKMVSETIVMDDDSHIDVKDVRLMKEMWMKANPSYLELLYTKHKRINPAYKEYWSEIVDIRSYIAKMNYDRFLSATKGMCMEKRKALCHEYPTTKDKIEKYGYDPKQLHHIVRLEHMIAEMMDGYSYGESLVRTYDRNMLLDIKTKPTMTANDVMWHIFNSIISFCSKDMIPIFL